MFVIRDIFTAKPGMASKLAKLIKDVWVDSSEDGNVRVLTDAVGQYNTVVMETEVKALADLEQRMKRYRERSDIREKMKGYTELWMSGRREILQVMD